MGQQFGQKVAGKMNLDGLPERLAAELADVTADVSINREVPTPSGRLQAVTEDLLLAYEEHLNFQLPFACREIMKRYANRAYFGRVPAGPLVKRGEQSWELKFVGEFLGVASEMYTTDAYQLEYSNRASIQYARANLRLELADSIVNPWLDYLIPVTDDDSFRANLCLDYAFDSADPPVVWLSYDGWEDDLIGISLMYVARTFDEFLGNIVDRGSRSLEQAQEFDGAPFEPARHYLKWADHRDKYLGR